MSEYFDVLVITPHPDDAELGAGGTIALWSERGYRIAYVVCSSGEKGTSDPEMEPAKLMSIREKEQIEAAKILGVGSVDFLRFPDQGIEDNVEFLKVIVKKIRQYRPRIVMTINPYRKYLWHRDHRITGQVVLDAVYPYARDHLAFPELLKEGLTPHKVEEIYLWGGEDVNVKIDISSTFDKKLRALLCHKSQIKEFGIPDMREWLMNYCREMAKSESFELAEGFHHIKIPTQGIIK
jgi:LmbE family N-acetylglucosaminyl deacetylase